MPLTMINLETGSLCLRAHNAIDSERPMAEAQKWVYHLHLEMTVLIAVAGENGRIVIQGGAEFNTIEDIIMHTT